MRKPLKCPDCGAMYCMKKVGNHYYCPHCIDKLNSPEADKIRKLIEIEEEKEEEIANKIKIKNEAKKEEEYKKWLKKIEEEEKTSIEIREKLDKIEKEWQRISVEIKIKELKETPFNFNKILKKYDDQIYHFLFYPKTESATTKEKLSYHYRILDMKNNKDLAFNQMFKLFDEVIKKDKNIVVCVIPSHNKGIVESSMRFITKKLCENERVDGNEVIYRKHEMPTKHKGGSRDITKEKESLLIQNESIIKDKTVVLLDDIVTSGTSMEACIDLLKKAGAKEVFGLAIARTI